MCELLNALGFEAAISHTPISGQQCHELGERFGGQALSSRLQPEAESSSGRLASMVAILYTTDQEVGRDGGRPSDQLIGQRRGARGRRHRPRGDTTVLWHVCPFTNTCSYMQPQR